MNNYIPTLEGDEAEEFIRKAESAEKAKEYADKQKGYDEIHVLFLPYVEFEGQTFALWNESSCN